MTSTTLLGRRLFRVKISRSITGRKSLVGIVTFKTVFVGFSRVDLFGTVPVAR